MKLVILGSGTCVPSLKRGAPAYLLETEDRQVLIDCGSGTLLQLEKAGRSYKDIDAVFITHNHPDHVAGIMPLIHALLAAPLHTRKKDLTLIGPKGFKKFYRECISSVMGRPETFSIRVVEIADKMEYPPFMVLTKRTVHSENSIAYRFEHKGRSFVYTGDADYDQGIIELSRDTDLLIADCSFPGSMKRRGHMTPEECGLTAEKAGVKNLILSHLHIVPVSDEKRLNECRQVFGGKVSLAEDFMEIII